MIHCYFQNEILAYCLLHIMLYTSTLYTAYYFLTNVCTVCEYSNTLTMQTVDPKIQQQTAHTNTAGTICDFSLQHSCQSRGNDGQNALHTAYTFYNAVPSLVASSHEQRNKKDYF